MVFIAFLGVILFMPYSIAYNLRILYNLSKWTIDKCQLKKIKYNKIGKKALALLNLASEKLLVEFVTLWERYFFKHFMHRNSALRNLWIPAIKAT